jgi:hypothetical protein
MPYNHRFLKLAVSGTLYETEGFTWSLNFQAIGENNQAAPDTVSNAVDAAIGAFWSQAGVTNAAKITFIKLNEIDATGKYKNVTATVERDKTSNPSAGSSQGTVPPQIALCVSLRTNHRRGRAHAGRFYLPAPSQSVGADGRISQNAAHDVATAATTMIDALNAELTGWRCSIMSKMGEGSANFVTHVEVGRVLDVMRSRRTSIDEGYQVGTDLAASA